MRESAHFTSLKNFPLNRSIIFWVDDDDDDFDLYQLGFHEAGFEGSIIRQCELPAAISELSDLISFRKVPSLLVIGKAVKSIGLSESVALLTEVVRDFPVPLVLLHAREFVNISVSDRPCIYAARPWLMDEVEDFCQCIVTSID